MSLNNYRKKLSSVLNTIAVEKPELFSSPDVYHRLSDKISKGHKTTLDKISKHLPMLAKGNDRISWYAIDKRSKQMENILKSINENQKILKNINPKKVSKRVYGIINTPLFTVIETNERKTHKLGITENTFSIVANRDIRRGENIFDVVLSPLKKAVEKAISKMALNKNSVVNLFIEVLENENFAGKSFISSGFVSLERLIRFGISDVIRRFALIMQSNELVNLTDVKIGVQSIINPSFGKHLKVLNKNDIYKKKCIINLQNKDNLCLARSVVCLMAKRNNHPKKEQIKKGRKIQETLAKELMEACKIEKEDDEFCDLNDVSKIEKHLNTPIKIFDEDYKRHLIYCGEGYDNPPIHLYKNKNHIVPITSMPAFFNSNYFCETCNKPYDKLEKHRCIYKKCAICRSSGCDMIDGITNAKWKHCNKCNRNFPSDLCFEEHVGHSCKLIKKCKNCKKNYYTDKDHECYTKTCVTCKVKYNEMENHKCYMQKEDLMKPSDKLIFFDFEATQETGKHVVNYGVAKYYDSDKSYIFKDNESFCKWLIKTEHEGYTVVAHNGRGYDFQFILNYCVNNDIKAYTVYAGSKIMYMSLDIIKMRFVDSLNFIPSALAGFPKIFDIKDVKKGYFPHFFNTAKNQNYVGPYPEKKYYGYFSMKTDQRTKFNEWYESVKGKTFDFRKEMRDYCEDDVRILRLSCIRFRDLFLEISNIDPFQYITIASVCQTIYKNRYLQENTIAISENVNHGSFSSKAIAWLSQFDGVKHALNGGEQKIKIGKDVFCVDGYDPKTNTVYEFHGCYFHGCNKCFSKEDKNSKLKVSMGELYDKTIERDNKIKSKYNLIVKWEHDFHDKVDPIKQPINPRDALFGGRTETFKMRYKCNEDEKIYYKDITSLYPTVMYYDLYPVGHPIRLTKNLGTDVSKYFGFVKCKVVPPKDLYLPILPARSDDTGKLTFDLQTKTGTWVSEELKLAVKYGYRIEEIYEVLHFEKSSRDLFKGYIKDFLKIKQESSGYPDDVKTEEDKDRYIAQYHKDMGILLDKTKIEKNPGKRQIAKLCLNSLWGKFAQRLNMTQSDRFYADPDNNLNKNCNYNKLPGKNEFYNLVLDKTVIISYVNIINDKCIEVFYKSKDEFVTSTKNTNVYIGCFTTANARLRLYSELCKLGRRALYCDTDSIIYCHKEGEYSIPNGNNLGEWTDEFEGKYGVDFVSTGPKCYAYKLNDGSTCAKAKGFTLNFKNSQKINFDTMTKLVNKEIESIDIHNKCMITRNKKDKTLHTVKSNKTYKFTFDKRNIHENMDTTPFGFSEN